MMMHSFIVIPFIIAVSCAMLVAAIRLLTREKQTVYDLLEDVKVGGATKRWQSAFELSKMLVNPGLIPEEESFTQEMTSTFRKSKQDDPRVRQYIALAMGRTGKATFFEPLTEDLLNEKQENLPAVIYAIGMLKDQRGAALLNQFLNHPDARIRSITVVALGNIAHPSSIDRLRKVLYDAEPNVQWGAAISLAKMGDGTGKPIILKMLDREYLSAFPEVDSEEQNYLLLSAIEAASLFDEPELNAELLRLSKTDSNMKVRSAALEKLK
ncbi:MAG: HEAT repeat domain-containing protein [Candidatus Omnitrophica bacterium]|nr:HEAT repeat domain-containing protein [Candidatus Omnitrophota bacterium]